MDRYAKQSGILKALAHPARLQIVDVLAEGEACVCHLEALLGYSQPYISRQLATLRAAGLVRHRRDGLYAYYRVADLRLFELVKMSRELAGDSAEADVVRGTASSGPTDAQCPCPGCTSTDRESGGGR